MKEIPLLFSAPMVRAVLEGRKTVTRRTRGLKQINEAPDAWECISMEGADFPAPAPGYFGFRRGSKFPDPDAEYAAIKSPYGVAGDRLWVRETWTPFRFDVECKPSEMNPHERIVYLADQKAKLDGDRYYPSIHMPRCFSRITLEVVSVRPERLHDITKEDSIAEGVQVFVTTKGCAEGKCAPMLPISRRVDSHPLWANREVQNPDDWYTGYYALLWEEINGAGSWAKNPWVWRVEFKVVQP